ncbi:MULTISPECIES: hypothetical protein [Paenibacillus]|nr:MULTISPECIES: hypothetical protein [Paenibacillus]CAH8709607.1 hypothetical protein HTL2_002347 [Paenibacillus melissococcoides]
MHDAHYDQTALLNAAVMAASGAVFVSSVLGAGAQPGSWPRRNTMPFAG